MRSNLSEVKRDLVAAISAIKPWIVLAVIQCRYTVELRGTVEPLSNDHPHPRPSLSYDHISCDGQCFLFVYESLTSDHPSYTTTPMWFWGWSYKRGSTVVILLLIMTYYYVALVEIQTWNIALLRSNNYDNRDSLNDVQTGCTYISRTYSHIIAFTRQGKPIVCYWPSSFCNLQVFFSILTGAVAIGLAGPKIQAIAVARGAANTIFKIIDRVRHVI